MWKKEEDELELEIENLIYPPSFYITVDGQQATATANVKIHFKTSESEEFSWSLPLHFVASSNGTPSEGNLIK